MAPTFDDSPTSLRAQMWLQHRRELEIDLHERTSRLQSCRSSIRYSGRHEPIMRTNLAALHDAQYATAGASPAGTPILARRVPLLGSPKLGERRLVAQRSLQTSPNGSSYDNQPPLNDDGAAAANGAHARRTQNERLAVQPQQQKSQPQQKSVGHQHQHFHHHISNSRLPQPQPHSSSCAKAYAENAAASNGAASSNLKRSNAILASCNFFFRSHKHFCSVETRPSICNVRRRFESAR